MALFDRLSKGVAKAAEQAKFEADKLVRVNKLNTEVSELEKQITQTLVGVGRQALELVERGVIPMPPELEGMASQVQQMESQLAAKRAELEAAKASKYEDIVGAAPGAAVAAPEEGGQFCPNCGEKVQQGAKFCPSCGQKIGA